MSVYGVHRLLKDPARPGFPRAPDLRSDHHASEFPLTDEERTALAAGEVGVLNRIGVHGYFLNTLARHRVSTLTPERDMERFRSRAAEQVRDDAIERLRNF